MMLDLLDHPADQTEAEVQADIRLAVGRVSHAKLFRNQVGECWLGEVVGRNPAAGTVTLKNPRRIPFGLHPGSGDLIGWTSVIVTSEMIGRPVAVFTSGEVKRPAIKRLPNDQQNWCDAIRAAGGFAAMIRSVDEGMRLVRAI